MSKKTDICRDLYEMLLVETVSEIHACTNITHTHTHNLQPCLFFLKIGCSLYLNLQIHTDIQGTDGRGDSGIDRLVCE